MYIVYIPWKHAMKDVVYINERNVISIDYFYEDNWINIDTFISKFIKEKPYYCEYTINNFSGYKFIYDNGFIANLRNGLSKYSLETLYSNLPAIIEEEFDEDTAVREYPLFITSEEREMVGTGFIELQYCKNRLPRKIVLMHIKNWKEESLYIGVEFLSIFLDQYLDIFTSVNKNLKDIYSLGFFTMKQVVELKKLLLKRKPIDYIILVNWLDICIKNKYSMYFLDV